MKILNLTQHAPTPEQTDAGVYSLNHDFIKRTLTFDTLPSREQINSTALVLARFAHLNGAKTAMIGGAPFLMAPLERALTVFGINFVYAFSERVSTETTAPDGTVTKVNTFKHAGFI